MAHGGEEVTLGLDGGLRLVSSIGEFERLESQGELCLFAFCDVGVRSDHPEWISIVVPLGDSSGKHPAVRTVLGAKSVFHLIGRRFAAQISGKVFLNPQGIVGMELCFPGNHLVFAKSQDFAPSLRKKSVSSAGVPVPQAVIVGRQDKLPPLLIAAKAFLDGPSFRDIADDAEQFSWHSMLVSRKYSFPAAQQTEFTLTVEVTKFQLHELAVKGRLEALSMLA